MENEMGWTIKSWTSWWNLLIVLPWVMLAIWSIYEWSVERKIAEREETVVGVITAHEPANHNRYGYSFSVKGIPYTGWESPLKEEPKLGEQVLVYYDPNDPSKNALTDFVRLNMNSLGPIPLLLVGIGTVAAVIAVRRRRLKAAELGC